MFSIKQRLHPYKDKLGRQCVQIRITYKRVQVWIKTDLRVKAGEPNVKTEAVVRKRMAEAEGKLLDALREGPMTAERLKSLFSPAKEKKIFLVDYFDTMIKDLSGKLHPATLKQYKVINGKISGYATPQDVSIKWLREFEKSISSLDVNTVNTQVKRLKAMLSRAASDGLISKDQFEAYKPPTYKLRLKDFLTEKEVHDFTRVLKLQSRGKLIAGWYFLLSCFTGWRISDVKQFSAKNIIGENLVIKTLKNGEIVSMPIIPRLKEVLEFVTKHPFNISEQTARSHVKDICSDAGITKDVSLHTGRRTFANLLRSKGFEIKQIAEKMGDSELITRVYARVHNESLDKKIRERLG